MVRRARWAVVVFQSLGLKVRANFRLCPLSFGATRPAEAGLSCVAPAKQGAPTGRPVTCSPESRLQAEAVQGLQPRLSQVHKSISIHAHHALPAPPPVVN